ncbi:hypothetical protein COLO4_23948 [Corchorus olitorius]|uniref:RNase H type-1 domain-containing protein n=1 Tax=Corchorus olitorius TaxID=93759 RepID=A0A1R3IDT9_9ROSI|nr:hypothetical protein COLO4_23948 [Corchorus olitorius]
MATISYHEQQCTKLRHPIAAASTNMVTAIRWEPPLSPMVKINVDASFDLHRGQAGLGEVIRDYNGVVLSCATKQCDFIQDSLFAEVYSIRLGLQLARDEGFRRVFWRVIA